MAIDGQKLKSTIRRRVFFFSSIFHELVDKGKLTFTAKLICEMDDGRMDGWTDGWMDGRTDGRTDGWMDVWMDGWTDGRMDR